MIKFASYNIRKSIGTDRKRQPERIMQILAELDADVVALQEVDRRFGQRATTLSPDLLVDFTHYMPVRFGIREQSLGWHGNVLLVKKGIRVVNEQRIELPAFEPRGAVMADVLIGDAAVRVVGMHLGLLGNSRTKQAEAIVARLEQLEGKMPTVIMGDLNQWAKNGKSLVAFAKHHDVITPGPSFHSRRPMLELDRIIVSRDFRVEGNGVHHSALARTGSDHLPVWATLSLLRSEAAA